MATDQEIASCVESLLRQSAGGTGTSSVNFTSVVQQLEAKLGFDLSHKAGFIRDQINLLLRPTLPPPFKGNRPQQFVAGQSHPLLPQHQYPPPSFGHLPPPDEVARGAASPPMQSQIEPQSGSGVAAVPKRDAHLAPGNPVPTATKKSASVRPKRKGGSGGLNKLCGVSPLLQAIVGEPELPRTQIVKELWAYIRKNNLQDPNNRRKIICNDELRLVFETDCTDMFQMNKLLAKHIMALPESNEPSNKKQKPGEDQETTADGSAGQILVMISDELARFFDSAEREMLQSDALKRIWDYVDTNHLKDPLNPNMVRCDEKLQRLFGCESLSALGLSEMLASHLFKQS